MSKYEGLANDTISGGFGYVTRHGYGHEIFNFKPYAKCMYGFARAPHDSIRLEKLGAPKDASSVTGVLVVWVAKSKIVGWYKNATVFRAVQPPPMGSGRTFRRDKIGYNVTAIEKNCKLLDPDARLFPIPRAKEREHAMGRYLWYAEGQANRTLRERVERYIAGGGARVGKDGKVRNGVGRAHQQDPLKRAQVEQAAILLTTRHFEALGYNVDSVETDNVGWDLDCVHRESGMQLKLEVKGLSGRNICVELTPHEYQMMRKNKQSYRICIATNCMQTGILAVFAYNQSARAWTDGNDRSLVVEEIESARLHV
jgi:hypothetical protein